MPRTICCRMAIASVASHADEADVCLRQFRKADAHLRNSRAFGIRAWSVLALLDTLVNTGRFTQADALIREAGAEAAVLRLPRLQADLEAQALTLLALRGAVPPEPWLTPSIWHAVSLDENRATHARLLRAQGLASMALGDWDGGWRHLRDLFTADGSPLHSFLSPRSIAELAVTAQRTGRTALPLAAHRGHPTCTTSTPSSASAAGTNCVISFRAGEAGTGSFPRDGCDGGDRHRRRRVSRCGGGTTRHGCRPRGRPAPRWQRRLP